MAFQRNSPHPILEKEMLIPLSRATMALPPEKADKQPRLNWRNSTSRPGT